MELEIDYTSTAVLRITGPKSMKKNDPAVDVIQVHHILFHPAAGYIFDTPIKFRFGLHFLPSINRTDQSHFVCASTRRPFADPITGPTSLSVRWGRKMRISGTMGHVWPDRRLSPDHRRATPMKGPIWPWIVRRRAFLCRLLPGSSSPSPDRWLCYPVSTHIAHSFRALHCRKSKYM